MSEARNNPDFDRDYAGEKWELVLTRFDTDYKGMITHCGTQQEAAQTRSDNASRFGTALLFTFKGYLHSEVGISTADGF